MKAEDLTGRVFGRLTLLRLSDEKTKRRSARWVCLCVCGVESVKAATDLKEGRVKSCGCLVRDNPGPPSRFDTKHGRCGTPAYKSWSAARDRCLNPSNKHYADYGGRGIRMCSTWDDFSAFFAYMGERPPGMTLDRIDNGQGYAPGNCRWADGFTQAANRRNVTLVELDGTLYTTPALGRLLGVSDSTIRYHTRLGKAPSEIASFLAKRRQRRGY